ncbi:transposase, MuDR [Tanacetum coccineum]|uniref:Transposase, MuDR n=1 Tax=Tanacetum coccineum TaxID=301880 RepID=A0ABQ4ZZB6_9ASTR
MVIVNWKLRPKENDPNLFSLKVNHGDGFSVIEVSGMLKELGYDNPKIKILYKKPTFDLDKGIEPLSKDIDVLDLLSYVHKFKLIELFIEHHVDTCVLDTFVIDLDHKDNSVSDGLKSGNASLGTHESEVLKSGNAGLGTHESEGIENDNAGLGIQESEGIENDNVEELDPLFSYPNTNHQIGQSSERITSPHRNVQGNDDNEESDDTKESEDNDFECDIEDRIDDVHVDMEMFKKTLTLDFDSDIDPDDDEAERKKALRKISKCHKPVDGHLYTENFYLKERNLDTTAKIDVERNYEPDSPTRKFRKIYVCLGALKSGFKAGQRDLLGLDGCFMSGPFPMQILTHGIIPALAETFLAAKYRNCYGDVLLLPLCPTLTKSWKEVKSANKEVYDWLKDIPPQHWARPHSDVLLNNMCEVLNKQLLDGREKAYHYLLRVHKRISYEKDCHSPAVGCDRDAMQACSGSYLEYDREWFKINPFNVPDLWPPSDSLIILTPPDYHTPIGKPPKKRNKSATELYDGRVKDGKLSRAGKIVTCLKCGQKGHNSRSCKGQRGDQSTGRPMPNQGDSQYTQIPSQGTVNPSTPTITVNPSA